MKPYERRTLQIYLRFHEKRPSVGRLFWLNRKVYLLFTAYFGALIAGFAYAFGWAIAGYVIVAVVAVLLRDLGYFMRTVRAWPLFDQLIDWQKAERLASNNDTPAAGLRPEPGP